MKIATKEEIVALLKKKNYKIFTDGRPNIIGVRAKTQTAGKYDDICYVFWTNGTEERFHYYTITTDPGTTYLITPANKKGAAILVEGQYLNCWRLGRHRQKQDALIQIGGEVTVYRDNNKDGALDMFAGTKDKGYFGINLHHGADIATDSIKGWSAGCQVWKFKDAHQKLIKDFKELSKKFNFLDFSYTLIKEEDLA